IRSGETPAEALGDAVDRGAVVAWQDWIVAPLSDGYVLAARSAARPTEATGAAEALGLALRGVDSRQQSVRRIRRLKTILEITHAWRQTNSMQSLLKAMAEAATELLGAERASTFLWDRANKQLVGRPALGVPGGELRIADDIGIVGQVIHTGETRRVGGGVGEEEIDRQVDATTGHKTQTVL
ncbi:MAG TPA: hypothetical protein PKC18_11660, partial [Lacipirellulaceae bacterium]|nr:hypothetical protein [Lacipirellulaceae bacterium]